MIWLSLHFLPYFKHVDEDNIQADDRAIGKKETDPLQKHYLLYTVQLHLLILCSTATWKNEV